MGNGEWQKGSWAADQGILDAGKKGRFSVMEMDWRGAGSAAGDSSSWYYGKYASRSQCRMQTATSSASWFLLHAQVYSYAFWFGFSNGENGEYSPGSPAHAAGDAGMAHVLLAWFGGQCAMEMTMELGKRHISLCSRV